MKNKAIKKIQNTRLARKAQLESGLLQEIKLLQKEIVVQSFSRNFNVQKHKLLMRKLHELKSEYKNLGKLQLI